MSERDVNREQLLGALGGLERQISSEVRRIPIDPAALLDSASRFSRELITVSHLGAAVIGQRNYDSEQERREWEVLMINGPPDDLIVSTNEPVRPFVYSMLENEMGACIGATILCCLSKV